LELIDAAADLPVSHLPVLVVDVNGILIQPARVHTDLLIDVLIWSIRGAVDPDRVSVQVANVAFVHPLGDP